MFFKVFSGSLPEGVGNGVKGSFISSPPVAKACLWAKRISPHLPYIILLSIPIYIFFYVSFTTTQMHTSDWNTHLNWSKSFSNKTPPNRLFHYIAKLTGYSFVGVALFATLMKASIAVIVATLYTNKEKMLWVRYLLGGAVAVAMPILWFTSHSRAYIGQFSANPVHNPTYLLMAPLALVTWYIFTRRILNPRTFSIKWFILLGILSALTVGAKPSFHLGFLGAAVLLCLWSLVKFRSEGWTRFWQLGLTGAILFLPFILMLGLVTGLTGEGLPSYNFAILPFAALKAHFTDVPGAIFAAFLMPLIAWVGIRDPDPRNFLTAGALLAGSCLFIMATFAESGRRLGHGNFYWTGYIGVLIVYAETVSLMARAKIKDNWRAWSLTAALLFLHVAFGVYYLVRIYGGAGYSS